MGMIYAGLPFRKSTSDDEDRSRFIETTKIVAPSLADASTSDVVNFVFAFDGPRECIELLFLQDYAGVVTAHQNDTSIWAAVLANAVLYYGSGNTEWEHLIRSLLRRIQSTHDHHGIAFELGDRYTRGTLLDQLFGYTSTPFEAEAVGQSWLHLLSSENFDVVAYLEREVALHAPDQRLFLSRSRHNPSRLVYRWDMLGVSWDWVNDPSSSIVLLQDELKTMIYWPLNLEFGHDHEDGEGTCWKELWPFVSWSENDIRFPDFYPCGKCRNTIQRTNERALRREEKKASKLARCQRPKGPRRVPGAWPM